MLNADCRVLYKIMYMYKTLKPADITLDGTKCPSESEDSCDWTPLGVAFTSLRASPIPNYDDECSTDGFDLEVEEVQDYNNPSPEETTVRKRQRSNKWLKCPHCPYYQTRLGSKLEDHKKLCFRQRWYKCSMCLFKTISANVSRRHFILEHTYKNKSKLQCKHCRYITLSLTHMELHQREYHRCAFCVCNDVTYVPTPVESYIDDRYFYCNQCSYRSKLEKNYKAHRRMAHDKELKAGACDGSGDVGLEQITLNRKKKGEMYFCKLCSYKFTSFNGYINHTKNHPIYMEETPVRYKTEITRMKRKKRGKKTEVSTELEPLPVVEHKCTNCAFKSFDETQLFIHEFSKICFRLNRINDKDKLSR